ncbi:MAG TPA: cytochrome c biogenesis protein CcsA [Gemmataceae bacterium]|jgi:ABC-type transport system involved in cytochrome c biogenesis permease subunit|nr:cytochrome c biogenesis protein CcsA [Gemmataceae bacterium]
MGVTHVCFGLSYLIALGLELAQQARPGRATRIAGLVFGFAGLAAHTIFLLRHQPNPASAYGSLLLLAWVLAVFFLYGSLHHRSLAWGLFVLPVVLILVWLSFAFYRDEPAGNWADGEHVWGAVHGILVLAASVGITVGFLASVMYLVQARRLRMKRNPLGGLRLLSLERLETMNRRAINWAFPLLTVGLLLGALRVLGADSPGMSWTDPKVWSTVGLWLVGLLLVFLRYGTHLPPRRLAYLTIAVFALMLLTLIASHPFAVAEVSR